MVDKSKSQKSLLSYWDDPNFVLYVELLALLLLVALALFLRLWRIGEVPPGFHFDEAVDLKIGLDVADGARPIYVVEGWGREALYYYLVAVVLQFVPYNPVALRISAVICGIGVLIAAYLLVRLLQNRLAAWLTVALLSVSFWPLSASRFGVRHISLAFMVTLASLVFWWAWKDESRRWWQFSAAGLLVGLTLYTYQPARFTPFVFAFFFLYLMAFHRKSPWTNWRSWIVLSIAFLLAALPLLFEIGRSGAIETEQRAFTVEPINQLLEGKPQLLLSNLKSTLKVFTVSGDPLKSYNLPNRPIFVPVWTGIFFYWGLALALWRWRKPVYAFVLLWLFFTILPTIVTTSAPNFNRMVASQVPIMFLAALPPAEMIKWACAGKKPIFLGLVGLLVGAGLVSIAASTWRDYFEVWPNNYGNTPILNSEIAAISDYLEHDPDSRPAMISSLNIADTDPYIVAASMDRTDLEIRWVDASQAIAIPAGVDESRMVVAEGSWIDDILSDLVGALDPPIYQASEFEVYAINDGDWTTANQTPLYYLDPDEFPPTSSNVKRADWSYPYTFCDCQPGGSSLDKIELTGLSFVPKNHNHENLELLTTWRTSKSNSFASLAMFVHLVSESGELVAQYDGLGYPPHTWGEGDRFVQLARLMISEDLSVGEYWLQLGLYDRDSGARWLMLNEKQVPEADRVLIGPFISGTDGSLELSETANEE